MSECPGSFIGECLLSSGYESDTKGQGLNTTAISLYLYDLGRDTVMSNMYVCLKNLILCAVQYWAQ